MKKVLLTTLNAKYIHKNLALRWLYTTCPQKEDVQLKEYTIKEDIGYIASDILSKKADVVCFSCYIWNIEQTLACIRLLKQERKDIHIIAGGPEVSYDYQNLLDKGIDAVSIGEGEESLWEYVCMLSEETAREVRGMYTKQFPNKEYRKTGIAWLEQFEDPYFLEMDKNQMGNRYFYLETSRGCPYGCTYCLSSTDRTVRMFSLDYVMKILEKLRYSDVRQVKLLDRTFNSNPKRALAIARYMNEYCKNQIFQFEIVAETLSEELLAFFCEEADTQRFRFEIGVQSFNSQTLSAVGRMQNNERLCKVIKRLKESGVTMHVDLIAGLPHEGIESFQKSFDQLFSLGASELQLGILKLLKGTKLRNQKDQYHFFFQDLAPYDVISTKWLTKEEMEDIHSCADAVEKFWNHGTCRFIISKILQLEKRSAFQLFLELGREYRKLPRPYQPYELFRCFYPLLKNYSKKEADAILLTQYYQNFKQKPHRFTDAWIDLEKKKEILAFALEKNIANQDQLYRYGLVDIAFDDELCYQLVLYNTNQQLPKIWLIDKNLTTIKELN